MNTHRIVFARHADRDVAVILGWICKRSPSGASHWLNAVEQALTRLGEDLVSPALAEEADAFSEPIRQIFCRTKRCNTYPARFVVRDSDVTILSIRGLGQLPMTPDELRLYIASAGVSGCAW